MEVVIKGEAKEIAALLLEIAERRNKEVDVDKIAQTLSKAQETNAAADGGTEKQPA